MKLYGVLILIILAACSLTFCIYRDIHIERNYGHDMRNRVVGARLQMDGKSPYYYHWKQSDGIRYWDWMNNQPFKISNVTASPFFHQLLYPVANLPQRTISLLWLAVSYLLVLGTTLIACALAQNKKQKWLVIITALVFLYSRAWTTSIDLGQYYMIVPFLAMAFFYLLMRRPSLWSAMLAGICAISLLLIRFNTVLILAPFILIASRYTIKFKSAFIAGGIAVLIFAFGSSQNRSYWSEYSSAIKDHIAFHQDLPLAHQQNDSLGNFTEWENWNLTKSREENKNFHYKRVGEYGNVFYIVQKISNWRMPAWLISVSCLLILVIISFLFYTKQKKNFTYRPELIALLGFMLYMITDICSPIHRYQYNATQFLFILLLFAAYYQTTISKWIVAGIITGLLLNALPGIVGLQRTIGEYIIYISACAFLINYKPATTQ